MSRIAKKSIHPGKASVEVQGNGVKIKGSLGEVLFAIDPRIKVEKNEEGILLTPLTADLQTSALWGTYASILKSHLKGVTEGFTKKLVVEGIGYKADVKSNSMGNELVMSLGFSHQVKMQIPEGLKVTVEKSTIVVNGISKEAVGSFAATVRAKKKPEPYKGKGIHYEDEIVRRKQGKKSV